MDNIYWHTEEPHHDNLETMQDYLSVLNMLDIDLVDGTYAEGTNAQGQRFEIHASGDGDFNNHKIEFKEIKE